MSNPSLSQFIVNHPLMLELQERLEKEWAEKTRQEQEKLKTENTAGMIQGTISGFGPNGPVISNITADSFRVKVNPDSAVGGMTGGYIPREFVENKVIGAADAKMENVHKGYSSLADAKMENVRKGYSSLADVLAKALDQAQNGKGNQRHQVGNVPFSGQPICSLTRLYGLAYPFGQAAKKVHEVGQLERKEAKLAEVLGAINYLAAAYIVISESK